jgi:crotonobetainyl-CoA:carnitine CoA-transferase CaiB-like acyl-CoA transferase
MGPLAGLRVLDLSKYLPGLYASLVLADMGADVVHVAAPAGDRIVALQAHRLMNRNKRSLMIDLKHPEGRGLLIDLARSADIFLEGFRPGVTKRLGIDHAALATVNPRLVYCSLTGYGHDGPARDRVGHDINYLARAGVLGLSGPAGAPPVLPPLQMADLGGGTQAATAILAALWHRERTGEGQFLDVSLFDCIVSWLTLLAGSHFAGQPPVRGELLLGGAYACYNVYETADGGWLSVGALEAAFWRNLCEALGLGEHIDRQFAPPSRQGAIIAAVQARFRTKTQAEWLEALQGVEACVEPVLSLDAALSDPHVWARRMVVEAPSTTRGKTVRMLGIPAKFSRTPGEIRSAGGAPGADGRAALVAWGVSAEYIEVLAASGAVRLPSR